MYPIRFLKTSFNQVWSGSTIASTASLVVCQQNGTFNGSRNIVLLRLLYLIYKVLINIYYFAADQGTSWSFYRSRDNPFMRACGSPQNSFLK